jgi:hypothetical protein
MTSNKQRENLSILNFTVKNIAVMTYSIGKKKKTKSKSLKCNDINLFEKLFIGKMH